MYLNLKIDAIEKDLNCCQISKFRATFVKNSNKKKVFYNGYKYAQQPYRPSEFGCCYNVDPDSEEFADVFFNCLGYLILDENGVLQPGTAIRHHHGPAITVSFSIIFQKCLCKKRRLNYLISDT